MPDSDYRRSDPAGIYDPRPAQSDKWADEWDGRYRVYAVIEPFLGTLMVPVLLSGPSPIVDSLGYEGDAKYVCKIDLADPSWARTQEWEPPLAWRQRLQGKSDGR